MSTGKVEQRTVKFYGLKLDDVREFKFQSRPYQWVEFKNVALKPGAKRTPRTRSGRAVPRTTTKRDIAASDFKLQYDQKCRTHNLVVSIVNNGAVTIPKFKLRYYKGDIAGNLDEAGNIHTGWHNAGPIEPGKTWNERTRVFHLPNGEYSFGVVLDYDNAIDEADESNNTATLGAVVVDGKVVKAEHKQIEMKQMVKKRSEQDPILRQLNQPRLPCLP